MMWNKRGSQMSWDVIFPIVQFMLTLAVFLILMKFVIDLSSGRNFEKSFYARDLALLVDTAQAAPGDLVYVYPQKIDDYEVGVKIEGNMVVLYDTDASIFNSGG